MSRPSSSGGPPPRLDASLCRGCGKPIIWGTTAEGKRIPLDPRAPVFQFDAESGEAINAALLATETRFFVSHFATCPEANRFSGFSGRRKRG